MENCSETKPCWCRRKITWLILAALLILGLLMFGKGLWESAFPHSKAPLMETESIEVTEVILPKSEIPQNELKELTEVLQNAYANEYSASVRYEKWAEQAEKTGWKGIGQFLRALAKSESVHAQKHAETLKKLGAEPIANVEISEGGTIEEMLKKSLESEKKTVEEFYSKAVQSLEKLPSAKNLIAEFRHALTNDQQHIKLSETVLKDLKGWNDKEKQMAVCTVCGTILEGSMPEKCPVCGATPDKFQHIRQHSAEKK